MSLFLLLSQFLVILLNSVYIVHYCCEVLFLSVDKAFSMKTKCLILHLGLVVFGSLCTLLLRWSCFFISYLKTSILKSSPPHIIYIQASKAVSTRTLLIFSIDEGFCDTKTFGQFILCSFSRYFHFGGIATIWTR